MHRICTTAVSGWEEIEDPLMQKVRFLDKLVDELARGKQLATVLRAWV